MKAEGERSLPVKRGNPLGDQKTQTTISPRYRACAAKCSAARNPNTPPFTSPPV